MQTMPPPGTVPPPQQSAVVRPRSALGRLVLSLAVLALGVVALVDVAGAFVPIGVYFTVPLAVVAAGLLVSARYGRARMLIGVGIALSLLLAFTLVVRGGGWGTTHQSVTWQPTSVEQLSSGYRVDAGNAVLDLSRVDFTGHATALDVRVSIGNLRIVLPQTVDVELRSTVDMGNATVLGQRWSGIGQSAHTITDTGSDGPGGGTLTLTAAVHMGNLEVRR